MTRPHHRRLSAWRTHQLGPAVAGIIENIRRPHLPIEHRFALLEAAGHGVKPKVYGDVASLARAIHRRRHGQALCLKPDRIMCRDQVGPQPVVAIYGEDQVGNRTRFIGYAWIHGADWRLLQAALFEAEPPQLEAA